MGGRCATRSWACRTCCRGRGDLSAAFSSTKPTECGALRAARPHPAAGAGRINDSRAEKLLPRAQAWERLPGSAAAVPSPAAPAGAAESARRHRRLRPRQRRPRWRKPSRRAIPRALHRDIRCSTATSARRSTRACSRTTTTSRPTRRPEGGHLQASSSRPGELPALDHPPGQALGSGRAGARGVDGASQAVPVNVRGRREGCLDADHPPVDAEALASLRTSVQGLDGAER